MRDGLLGNADEWEMPDANQSRRDDRKQSGGSVFAILSECCLGLWIWLRETLKPGKLLWGFVLCHCILLLITIGTDSYYEGTTWILWIYYSVYLPFRIACYLTITYVAIRFQNAFEMGMISYLMSTLWTIAVIISLDFGHKGACSNKGFCETMTSLILILQLAIYTVGYRARGEYRWRFFRVAGTSIEIKRLFDKWQKLQSLLKLEIYANVILALKLAFFGLTNHIIFMGLAGIGLVGLQIPLSYTLWMGVKHEHNKMVYCFYAMSFIEISAVGVCTGRVIDFGFDKSKCKGNTCEGSAADGHTFEGVSPTDIIMYGVVTTCIRLANIYLVIILQRNFGKGLKEVTRAFISDTVKTMQFLCCQCNDNDEAEEDDMKEVSYDRKSHALSYASKKTPRWSWVGPSGVQSVKDTPVNPNPFSSASVSSGRVARAETAGSSAAATATAPSNGEAAAPSSAISASTPSTTTTEIMAGTYVPATAATK